MGFGFRAKRDDAARGYEMMPPTDSSASIRRLAFVTGLFA
jgi:hypothetical protein